MSDVVGKYRLVRRIGQGGMAEVWKARAAGPVGFSKTVAIKRIHQHLAAEGRAATAFADEARLTARLVHPNIVQVFDFGFGDDGTMFFAMEYVDGVDLRTLLDSVQARGEKLSEDVACHIATQVMAGLGYAHNATDDNGKPLGIIHRDISPHNIMVSSQGEVKVTDFGIAKFSDAMARRTEPNVIKGKISYMSPEQARQNPMDKRTDLFALGLVLWELVTGERYFQANGLAQMYNMVSSHTGVAPADLEQIPFEFQSALRRSLEPEPDMRFADADEFEDALEGAMKYRVSRVRQQLQQLVAQAVEPEEVSDELSVEPDPAEPRPTLKPTSVSVPLNRIDPLPDASMEQPLPIEEPAPPPAEPPERRSRRGLLLLALGIILVGAAVGYVISNNLGDQLFVKATPTATPAVPTPSVVETAVPTTARVKRTRRPKKTPTVTTKATPERTPITKQSIRPTLLPAPTINQTSTPVATATPTPAAKNNATLKIKTANNRKSVVKVNKKFVGRTGDGALIVPVVAGNVHVSFTAGGDYVAKDIWINKGETVQVKGDLKMKTVTHKRVKQ